MTSGDRLVNIIKALQFIYHGSFDMLYLRMFYWDNFCEISKN